MLLSPDNCVMIQFANVIYQESDKLSSRSLNMKKPLMVSLLVDKDYRLKERNVVFRTMVLKKLKLVKFETIKANCKLTVANLG